jgi:lariat debranching enzyme
MPLRKETPPIEAPSPKEVQGVGPTSINVASSSEPKAKPITIAVQGCCHGELNKIYDECRRLEMERSITIDLLICCGDFQALRCPADFSQIAMPAKYVALGDFPSYHNGSRVAPIPTLFIGGNHEASHLLWQEYYGGYIAPNIYYLGHSGVVEFRGLTIAGLSGIYKSGDYQRAYQLPPYDAYSVKGAYHVREFEIEKLRLCGEVLAQGPPVLGNEVTEGAGPAANGPSPTAPITAVTSPGPLVDIFLSHDWPSSITDYGDQKGLFAIKPFLEEDVRHGQLGNPQTMKLLRLFKPQFWFAAHYHCRFEAAVHHLEGGEPTQFLALDKCVTRRTGKDQGLSFIEIVNIVPKSQLGGRCQPVVPTESEGDKKPKGSPNALFRRVDEWLRVVRETHSLLSTVPSGKSAPSVQYRNPLLPLDQLGAPLGPKGESMKKAKTTNDLLRLLNLPSPFPEAVVRAPLPWLTNKQSAPAPTTPAPAVVSHSGNPPSSPKVDTPSQQTEEAEALHIDEEEEGGWFEAV